MKPTKATEARKFYTEYTHIYGKLSPGDPYTWVWVFTVKGQTLKNSNFLRFGNF
jgi:hypothetical protein